MTKTNLRKAAATLFLILNTYFAFGQELTDDQKNIVFDFIDCIKHQKKEKLISKISFPFDREYPIPQIKTREEFLKRYNEVFDENLIKMIVNSKPNKDWAAVGWRGIMLFHGDVWLDYDGKLIAVNYQSAVESKKKEELIAIEKSHLHESIKEYKSPIHILETTKYKIRIDDLGDYNYRYCSWLKNSKMSDKPDIIIEKGEFKPDGSGGNHSYVFKRGGFIYECSIVILGEENSPPAYLTIYKGDKEVFSDKANIVLK
jgi:hypothetical protein